MLGGVCGVWNLRPPEEVKEEASESECGGMIGLGGLSSSVWDCRRWKAASSTYFMRNDFIPWEERQRYNCKTKRKWKIEATLAAP